MNIDPRLNALHINTCVYEIVVPEKGENKSETYNGKPQHLFKQVNNPIYVKSFTASNVDSMSNNDIEKDTPGIYAVYPAMELPPDHKCSWIVVSGIEIVEMRPDPNHPEPIIVPADTTPEEEARIKREALETKYIERPFKLYIPRTPELMFDFAISHVPPTAVTVRPVVDETAPEDIPEEVAMEFQKQVSEIANKE